MEDKGGEGLCEVDGRGKRCDVVSSRKISVEAKGGTMG